MAGRARMGAAIVGLALALLMVADAQGAVLVYRDTSTNQIFAAYATGSHRHVVAHGLDPFVSPDGRRVAFFRKAPGHTDDLYVVSTKGGRRRLVARGAWTQTAPRSQMWSPDNRHLVVGDITGYGAFLVDVVRRTHRVLSLESDFGGVSFSPSGKQFALVDSQPRESNVYILRADGSHPRRLGAGGWPAWGSPGLAFAGGAGVVLKPGPGRRARVLARSGFPVSWSADGHALLTARCDSLDSCRAVLVDPRTGGARELPITFTSIDGLSRDGSSVLGEMDGNVVSVRADGTKLRVLAHEAAAASWSR